MLLFDYFIRIRKFAELFYADRTSWHHKIKEKDSRLLQG